jgi:hypothetical protein
MTSNEKKMGKILQGTLKKTADIHKIKLDFKASKKEHNLMRDL